jgi:hypothetical protein
MRTPPVLREARRRSGAAWSFHLFEGMGHVSIFGHGHEIFNPFIRDLIDRYV